MKHHIKLTIKGRVQGVWFRANTKQKADELAVKGFVKNLENGSVYIEAEGSQEQLDLFAIWCHEGPPLSNVNEVFEQKGAFIHFTNFEVR